MEKRSGRFVVDKKIMRIGTEVYREIIDKMLSVHIAYMERKMRSCLQCPPVCAPVQPRRLKEHPYTSRYKGEKFLPQHMLPTYLLNALTDAQRHTARDKNNVPLPLPERDERRIRRRVEEAEQDLDRARGDPERAMRDRADLHDRQIMDDLWDMHDYSWEDRPHPDDVREEAPLPYSDYLPLPRDRAEPEMRGRVRNVPVEDLRGDASGEIPDVGRLRPSPPHRRSPSPPPPDIVDATAYGTVDGDQAREVVEAHEAEEAREQGRLREQERIDARTAFIGAFQARIDREHPAEAGAEEAPAPTAEEAPERREQKKHLTRQQKKHLRRKQNQPRELLWTTPPPEKKTTPLKSSKSSANLSNLPASLLRL